MENEKKIVFLERLTKQHSKMLSDLLKRLTFLDRENARRKQEINQLSTKK